MPNPTFQSGEPKHPDRSMEYQKTVVKIKHNHFGFQIIRPFVLKHEKKIDETIDRVTDMASDVIDEGEKLNTVSKLKQKLIRHEVLSFKTFVIC